jgi:hypothetical protein
VVYFKMSWKSSEVSGVCTFWTHNCLEFLQHNREWNMFMDWNWRWKSAGVGRIVNARINTSGWKARAVCVLPLIAELHIIRSFKSIELCEVIWCCTALHLYSKSSLTLKKWRFNLSFPWVSMVFLNSWRVCVVPYYTTTTLQLFKNSTDTQEKLRLNLHSFECLRELLEYSC